MPLLPVTLVMAACLFGSAGTLSWWNAWVYLLFHAISSLSVLLFVYPANPGLALERRTAREKVEILGQSHRSPSGRRISGFDVRPVRPGQAVGAGPV